MGRIRSLKPEVARNRDLADVPPEARWTFVMLWPFLDDEGRGPDDARLIKADVYPLDNITVGDVEDHLGLIAKASVLCRYAGPDGRRYLHVPGFTDDDSDFRQRPQKRQPSRIPPCPGDHQPAGQGTLFDPSDTGTGTVPPVVVGEGSSRGSSREEKTDPPIGEANRRHRIPDDFAPSAEDLAWAQRTRPDVDAAYQTRRFIQHWRGTPGAAGEKTDWHRTWRNWISRSRGGSRAGPPARRGGPDLPPQDYGQDAQL